jgi:hypothetical protein
MGKVVDTIGAPLPSQFHPKTYTDPFIIEKNRLPSSALRLVKPVFVSVDPARDSVEQVRRYAFGTCISHLIIHSVPLMKNALHLTDFHPRLIALTGSYAAVKSMCKVYRVYFSSPPPKEGGEKGETRRPSFPIMPPSPRSIHLISPLPCSVFVLYLTILPRRSARRLPRRS